MQNLIEALGTSVSEITEALAYYRKASKRNEPQVISGSKSAAKAFSFLTCKEREVFAVCYLNQANEVLDIRELSQGGIATCLVDVRLVLKHALLISASAIICAHNHPSGSLRPSDADKAFSLKLKKAAKVMDIRLLDSIIVSHRGYYSLADEGQL